MCQYPVIPSIIRLVNIIIYTSINHFSRYLNKEIKGVDGIAASGTYSVYGIIYVESLCGIMSGIWNQVLPRGLYKSPISAL